MTPSAALKIAIRSARAAANRAGRVKGRGGAGRLKCPVCEGGALCYYVQRASGNLKGWCENRECAVGDRSKTA